jgi:mycofactocin precursor
MNPSLSASEQIEHTDPGRPAPPATPPADPPRSEQLVEQELLVEDVSIDGMCGVY